MRKKLLIMFSFMLIMLFVISICFAENPIEQTIYTADPAPMVYNDRVYVYTTHDEDVTVNNFFTMNDWRCFSTTDMVNWTVHGKVLSYTDFSWARGDAWAGQCVYRNGKFYFYVPVNQKNGGNAIGVGVSDSPTGPFRDAIGRPLASGNGYIDPTVYIDNDGQAYLYWGNPNLWYVKLNQDMISYSGSINQIPLTTASFGVRSNTDRPTSYEEGPWFYKRNNLYYMVFAGGPISEHIAYSTSSGPTGPWTYRGKIMPTQGGSFTNHPGVCDYMGNSYFFYHNGALPGGGGYKRSVCVEKFTYNADGTFPTINMTTTGAPQIGTLNPYVTTQAETICWESSVETEVCGEGGMDVCNIENGDYIKVKGVDFSSGATSFEARVASATNGGNIEIRLNSSTGTLVGTCAVTGTGGWQTWVTKTCTISGATGVHDLYLRFTGGSGSLFNFNWWKFYGTGIPTPTPPPVTPTPVPTPTTGPRSAFTQLEAESFNAQSGIQSESCTEGGQNIGYIENGDYVVYNNIDFESSAESFHARIASATSGGNIEIRLDSISGTLVGTCTVAGTGDWQTWTTSSCSVSGASGRHDLYLKFTGGSGYLFNMNWFQFNRILVTPTPSATTTPTPVLTPTPVVTSSPTVTPTPVRTATPRRTATPARTATPRHTATPGRTATPRITATPAVTATPTPVVTTTPLVTAAPSPTATPSSTTGDIKVQFYNQSTAATTNQVYLNIILMNTGTGAIAFSDIKIRYYYTADGTQPQTFYCDYSTVGSSNVTGNFVTMAAAKTGADTYVEIEFSSSAGSLAAGESTTIQARFAKNDWSNYTQSNDYSFNSSASSYVDWTKVTGYVSGALAWGSEP